MVHSISQIAPSILNDTELTELTSRICDAIEPALTEPHEHLTPLITDCREQVIHLQNAVHRARGSELTNKLDEIHKKRVELVKAIVKGIEFYQNHTNSEMVTAANRIKEKMDIHLKGYHSDGKASVSAKLDSFIREMESEEVQTALTLIALKEFYDSLVAVNDEFKSLQQERADEEAKDDTPLLIPTRKVLRDNLATLEYFFNFHGRVDAPQWSELIGKLNEHIVEINTIAKSRKTRSEDELSAEDAPLLLN